VEAYWGTQRLSSRRLNSGAHIKLMVFSAVPDPSDIHMNGNAMKNQFTGKPISGLVVASLKHFLLLVAYFAKKKVLTRNI
jgi:hypothetical protein